MQQRLVNHPFERVSAYKVRESRNNLRHECDVVASIARYVSARPRERHPSLLLGCTEDDKAYRLKLVSRIIAHELGYNLIPALGALTLEGIEETEITAFLVAIRPSVEELLDNCDAVQRVTARSVKSEYAALRAGSSATQSLCGDALAVAEQAVAFCHRYGVL